MQKVRLNHLILIDKLNDKIVSLEKATDTLSKENHSLKYIYIVKTQLGTMKSEMKN